jgi:hypothetical protein
MISRFTNEKDFQQVFVKKEVLAIPRNLPNIIWHFTGDGYCNGKCRSFSGSFFTFQFCPSKAIEFKTKDLVPFT